MRVAIIGAGISGLYLSLKLAKKHQVFLFEKKERIGGKPCSALYSERIFDFLPTSKDFIKNKIEFCILHFPKKKIKLKFKKKFFVFDRDSLEKHLFNLAKESRVRFEFKKRINFDLLEEMEKDFERIIGCDGANSQVRNFLKLKKPKFYLGIQGFVKEKDFSNFTEIWPTKNGFLWRIPRGFETEYGIIEEGKKAMEIFKNFQKWKGLNFFKKNSAPIPQGFLLPENQKITLCGDAAGLTKPWSGGGVIWGLFLANILLKNFPDFLKYKKEAQDFFFSQILFSKLTKKLVYFLGFKFPYILFSKYQIDGDFLFKSVEFSMDLS
jgi:flavin-dependent dehydrogenase